MIIVFLFTNILALCETKYTIQAYWTITERVGGNSLQIQDKAGLVKIVNLDRIAAEACLVNYFF